MLVLRPASEPMNQAHSPVRSLTWHSTGQGRPGLCCLTSGATYHIIITITTTEYGYSPTVFRVAPAPHNQPHAAQMWTVPCIRGDRNRALSLPCPKPKHQRKYPTFRAEKTLLLPIIFSRVSPWPLLVPQSPAPFDFDS